MTSRELLANALDRVADEIDAIRSILSDPKSGLAAIRTKLDMVTDDHDEALRLLSARVRALEPQPNGKSADA